MPRLRHSVSRDATVRCRMLPAMASSRFPHPGENATMGGLYQVAASVRQHGALSANAVAKEVHTDNVHHAQDHLHADR